MNVLVINLTRFGDLLQTQPVILGLKAQGHRVGLLCLGNFAPAAALLDGVDYLAVLPGGALLSQLDKDWRLALHAIHGLLSELEQNFPVDTVVNTTATLGARLLARRLVSSSHASGSHDQGAGKIWGFGLDAEGFGVSGDMWATFLQGTSAERLNCPFNIVDMFRMAAQVGDVPCTGGLRAPGPEVAAATQSRLDESRPAGCQGFVTFQLGASEARRQWPVAHFAALGARLWRELRLCPVLVGSPGERDLAEAYAREAAGYAIAGADAPATAPADTGTGGIPFLDCIGGTDVPHLAGVLLASRLLVSNDTGTMHLAAGLGVPVLGIFLATAQPWDTGPYLAGCCCLEPALPCHPCPFHQPCSFHEAGAAVPQGAETCAQPCLTRISAVTVFQLAQEFLQTGQWPTLVQNEARVWLTIRDAAGFADLRALYGGEVRQDATQDAAPLADERGTWLRLQRYFYRQILDALEGRAVSALSFESSKPSVPSSQGLSPDFRLKVHTALRQAEELLHLLCEQARLAQLCPDSSMAQRMLGTCARVHTVLEQCAPLRALGHLWQVLSQERGGDLTAFTTLAQQLRLALAQWRQTLE